MRSKIKTNIEGHKRLQNYDHTIYQQLIRDIDECKVKSEFKGESTFKIDFHSQEVVIFNTILYVVLVRFTFFYWIWYYHICPQEQLQGSFSADPSFTKGFFALKPMAARDKIKVEKSLSEIFARIFPDIVSWAKQLGVYVESRFDPLRKIGPIIE